MAHSFQEGVSGSLSVSLSVCLSLFCTPGDVLAGASMHSLTEVGDPVALAAMWPMAVQAPMLQQEPEMSSSRDQAKLPGRD